MKGAALLVGLESLLLQIMQGEAVLGQESMHLPPMGGKAAKFQKYIYIYRHPQNT